MTHRWSGWPGAWCLDCGCEDPMEIALADGHVDENCNILLGIIKPEQNICPEPGSKRFDPYNRENNKHINH